MELQQLKIFAAVARHRNITKAAYELHTSQPALSKQLKKLEDTYDVRLLTRSAVGVDLTPEGVEFLKYVEPILQSLDNLERRFLKRAAIAAAPAVRVGAGYALSASLLPEVVEKFRREYPSVELILRSNVGTVLERMLIKDSLDLIITSLPPDRPELAFEPCMKIDIVAVAARGYSLPKHNTLKLKDLENLPLVVHSNPDQRGMTETFLRELRAQGIKPKILLRCDSPEAIKAAVLRKLGVGIIYYDVVREGLERRIFKSVRIAGFPSEAESYVVYHKQRPLSLSGEAFLKILRRHCRPTKHEHAYSSEVAKEFLVER
jgi:DNA-binding transcriptional LysR family regulator